MNSKNVLEAYLKAEESNIIITNENLELIYSSEKTDIPAELMLGKIRITGSDFDEQEFYDRASGRNFKVNNTVIEQNGEKFYCFRVSDESEYTQLVREVANYSKRISDMSKFQRAIMSRLSQEYDAFLPGLADYCKAEEIMMLVKKDGIIKKSTYIKELIRERSEPTEEYERYLSMKRGEESDGLLCILDSEIQEHRCAVFVRKAPNSDSKKMMEATIHNVISLFIENSILRDKIVYESEHDKLTGLYNKGKYMALKKITFGRPSTIAIYNFDVNNLKHINDNYGHEYGDALIIKAAKSIAAVVSDKVYGFRMGGDEYVMVAVDLSAEEAEDLRAKWKASLDKLNEEDRSLFCSMACGLSHGSGDYDYEELYARADSLMYTNKKELKDNGITSHIVKE